MISTIRRILYTTGCVIDFEFFFWNQNHQLSNGSKRKALNVNQIKVKWLTSYHWLFQHTQLYSSNSLKWFHSNYNSLSFVVCKRQNHLKQIELCSLNLNLPKIYLLFLLSSLAVYYIIDRISVCTMSLNGTQYMVDASLVDVSCWLEELINLYHRVLSCLF